MLHAAATGRLADQPELEWSDDAAVAVVLAAENYPGTPVVGGVVEGLQDAAETGALVVHAGTALDGEGRTVSSGGRVLSVVGLGSDLDLARERAYAGIARITLPGSFYRTDIAARVPAGVEA